MSTFVLAYVKHEGGKSGECWRFRVVHLWTKSWESLLEIYHRAKLTLQSLLVPQRSSVQTLIETSVSLTYGIHMSPVMSARGVRTKLNHPSLLIPLHHLQSSYSVDKPQGFNFSISQRRSIKAHPITWRQSVLWPRNNLGRRLNELPVGVVAQKGHKPFSYYIVVFHHFRLRVHRQNLCSQRSDLPIRMDMCFMPTEQSTFLF